MSKKLDLNLIFYMIFLIISMTLASNQSYASNRYICLKIFSPISKDQASHKLVDYQENLFQDPFSFWKTLNDRLLEREKTNPQDKWNFSVADLYTDEANRMIHQLTKVIIFFKGMKLPNSQAYAEAVLIDLKLMTSSSLPPDQKLPYWKFMENGRRFVACMTLYTSGISGLIFRRRATEERAKNLLTSFRKGTDIQFSTKINDKTVLDYYLDGLNRKSSDKIHLFWVPFWSSATKPIFLRLRSSGLFIIDYSGKRKTFDGLTNDAPDDFTQHDEIHALMTSNNINRVLAKTEEEIKKEVHFDVFLESQIQGESDPNIRKAALHILFELSHEQFLSDSDFFSHIMNPQIEIYLNDTNEKLEKINFQDRRTWWNEINFLKAFEMLKKSVLNYDQLYKLPSSYRP